MTNSTEKTLNFNTLDMKTELAKAEPTQKRSVISALATRYEVEPKALLNTLKNTAFKGATDEQMMALCVVANEYGLNPFTSEIYAFPDKGGIKPVIGVDGWFRVANNHAEFNGVEFEQDADSCTCRIYRKDRDMPTQVTEWLEECRRNTPPWNQSPKRMLRHRAFIQCARIAFGISASDPEDAARIEEPVVSSTVTISPPSRGSSDLPFHAPDAIEPDPSPSESASVGGSFTLEAEPDAFPADAPPAVQYRYLTEKAVIHDEEVIDALRRLKVIDGRTKALKADHVALVVAKWDDVKEAVKANRAEALTGEGAE